MTGKLMQCVEEFWTQLEDFQNSGCFEITFTIDKVDKRSFKSP